MQTGNPPQEPFRYEPMTHLDARGEEVIDLTVVFKRVAVLVKTFVFGTPPAKPKSQ